MLQVIRRRRIGAVALAVLVSALAACGEPDAGSGGGFRVVTTVAPITDLVRNVAGNGAEVQGIVPEGVDSHTFEPSPESARLLAEADLVVLNGLHLEDPTLRLAEANLRGGAEILSLGDRALDRSEYIFDFSFPRSAEAPNPHVWMDPVLAADYVRLVRDRLAALDPDDARSYRTNAERYLATLDRLDDAVRDAVGTIPAANRVLLTYHDSFAYFARRYGLRVIGAIQPASFSEPSARDVAALIDQIRRQRVPAIFGSEVFPSPVLEQIARETGVRFRSTLRDDDLPGRPGDPEHSYVGLIIEDVRTMVRDLGGQASALDGILPRQGSGG